MLSSLEQTDFSTVISEKANVLIKKDRMRFNEVYRVTEEYCKNNDIIIGDVNVIADSKTDKDFQYNLYCEFPYKHAMNLANLIHSNVGEWVKMKTVVGHQEFTIEYDMRPLIQLYSLDGQKNVNLHSLILPVKINELLYMSPEIEIIDIYHKLYSPNYSEDWEDLVVLENKLFTLLGKRVTDGVFGGKQSPQDKTDFQYLKYLVLSEFCSKFIKDYVVIGHWALHVIEASKDPNSKMNSSVEKLQVITSIPIKQSIENVTNFIQKYTNAKVSSRRQDLHIPKDFRTRRYTIYISVDGKDKAFMDIFDCGTFELVPYIPFSLKTTYAGVKKDSQFNRGRGNNRDRSRSRDRGNNRSRSRSRSRRGGEDEFIIKVGNPYVLLRFLVIDLWIIRMIHEMGHLTNDMLKVKTKYIMFVIDKIKNPELGIYDKVFGSNYVGTHKDYDISKKVNNLKGKMFYPYYPERDMINNGAYKTVT